jgi:hypothetical protein
MKQQEFHTTFLSENMKGKLWQGNIGNNFKMNLKNELLGCR